MHIGYVTQFGWFKKEYSGPEEIRKDFSKFKKSLKEQGIEFLFYAGSYGVEEPIMWAAKLKDIKDWEKAMMARVGQTSPLDKTRTIFGWDYEE
jgi:uncharacterized phage-like protein YoqJ